MSDELQKKIFSNNLTRLLHDRNKTQLEVANAIGVSPQTFNTWVQGIAMPRMGKLQLLADYFYVEKSTLIEPQSEGDNKQTYYTNPETAKVAQEIFDNSDLRILFDTAKDSTPEQLKLAAEMLKQFKKTTGEE